MHPIYEVDVLLLLAVSLASKRRPAELVEIVAATDLLNDAVPSETRFADAIRRLSIAGLILEAEAGRFALTPEAEKIVTGLPKKGDTAERMAVVWDRLVAYSPAANEPAVVTPQQACAAILAHRASGQGVGKNMLMPKPKVEEDAKRRAPFRRGPGAPRRR